MNVLPDYLRDLVAAKVIEPQAFAKGLSRFLKAVPDLLNDYPKLTTYLSKTMQTLIELNAFKVEDLVWIEQSASDKAEDEDDMVFVEPYYYLMAEILKIMYQKGGSWKKVAAFFKDNGLSQTFYAMRKKILEDDLFEEIKNNLGSEYSEVIVPLLQNDQETLDQVLKNK